MIFDLLKDLNQDCSFTEKINESPYIQVVNNLTESQPAQPAQPAQQQQQQQQQQQTHPVQRPNNSYHNFVSCIISEYDPMYQTLSENEKKLYLKQKITGICSEIEEKSDTCYHNYCFNEKIMKLSIIQHSLQLWEKKGNYISSIYYLNEYYKKHFVITHQNIAYETTVKNFPKVYLSIHGNRIKMIDDNNFQKGNLNDLFDKIQLQNDIKKDMKSVYKMFLDPISKCKVDDLKKIALECNLSLKDVALGKNKVKSQLYDEINLYKLNE